MSKKLCSAFAQNDNPSSRFKFFELITVREYSSPDGGTYIDRINTLTDFYADGRYAVDDPFYQIYGHYKIGFPQKERFIAEFFDLDSAVGFLQDLVGERKVNVTLF